MKKYLTMFFVAVLLLALLSGCSGGETPSSEPESPSVPDPAPAEKTEEKEGESDSNEPPPAEETSALPDALPPELNDAVSLNEYAINLMFEYVKPNIFKAPVFSEEEIENARKALQLIIAAEDKAIALYDQNEHFYYTRGNAYAHCYDDTGDKSYKDLALADLKKAADMGLDMARTDHDRLMEK